MRRVLDTPTPLSEDRIAEAIARKVVAIVRDELGLSRAEEWIDAKEVARRFGLSRSWVYEHAGMLGARRAGTGKRPRLRFEPQVVADALRGCGRLRSQSRTPRSWISTFLGCARSDERRPHRCKQEIGSGGLRACVAGLAVAAMVAILPTGSLAAPAFETEQFAKKRGISLAEAERRLDTQAQLPELEERMRKALDGAHGGIWVDTNASDTVKVGVANADAIVEAKARAELAASGIDAKFQAVERSAAELERASEWLTQRLANWSYQSFRANGSGCPVPALVVTIGPQRGKGRAIGVSTSVRSVGQAAHSVAPGGGHRDRARLHSGHARRACC